MAPKRLALLITIALCLQLGLYSPVQSTQESPTEYKELNFVFLHGAGGTTCATQLLADSIAEQLPTYILNYEHSNPNIKIRAHSLNRCYPNDVNITTWADNIADSINKHFHDKRNLILIGHSMGGKTAIYAAARNVGDLADKVALVVTINAPIKPLARYRVSGGGSTLDYCRARWLLSDRGVCTSIAYHDSSEDGDWVGRYKHWLAFISGESAPLSKQFDFGGVDPYPWDMDDGVVPVSAQYSDEADIVYYGEHGHSDFEALNKVAGFMASETLSYLFGGNIECSTFAKGGSLEHESDWLLGKDYWQDLVGEVPISSGTVWHWNESYTKWQEWEDVVGNRLRGDKRSSYQINRVRSSVLFTSIEELRWLNPDEPENCQLYLRTRAGPRNYLQVDWNIYGQGLLPAGAKRDHYEVEIASGTPLTNIRGVSWASNSPRDLRMQIWSEAESPFQWFKAEWRVYCKESRQRKVIDEIPTQSLLLETAQKITFQAQLLCCGIELSHPELPRQLPYLPPAPVLGVYPTHPSAQAGLPPVDPGKRS